jgi:hypothetical protein
LRFRSPLLAQSLSCFLLLQVLRCFSSLGSLSDLHRNDVSSTHRVAPFGHLWIYFLFADPHSFSQLITSFFASESLGIPHTPFLYFFLYKVQNSKPFANDLKQFNPLLLLSAPDFWSLTLSRSPNVLALLTSSTLSSACQ